MKAAILKAKRTLECCDIATPESIPGEVLVRVAYCGVCGSDVPRYLNGAVHAFPLILGHEFSGRVESVGKGADQSLIGKRVAGIPLVPCMKCDDCMRGNFALCKHYSFIGSRQPGAYAQYVCVPEQNVFQISDDVGDLQAAFFEPASVAQHAVNLVGPQADSTAVISGCGTIGIFTAQILQAIGIEVTALARSDERINAAYAAGVKNICNTSKEDWIEGLKRSGFDYVFDTSGSNACMAQSLELAANKATVCYVGTPKHPMELTVRQWENINRKELTVTGSWMSYSAPWPGREWRQVEEGFASGNLRVVDEMVDSIYTIETICEGMEKFDKPNNVKGKIIIDCR